jgi:ABC-type branched-subunit amino acid transport system ATPase component
MSRPARGQAPAPAPCAGPLLEVRSVAASYGRLQVLFDVSLSVQQGEAVALLGTNGAGKSTLLKVVAGLLAPLRGTVAFDGEDLHGLPPEARARRGLVLVQGGRAVFPSASVEDNLRIGAYHAKPGSAELAERLEEALALFPALRPRLAQPAGTLSGGEQQMVALARAVVQRPRLLLVDELSLGLAPVVLVELAKAVGTLTTAGKTLVLVEQSLNVAAALARRAVFMEKGEIRFSGATEELLERGDLVRSVFFGTAAGGARAGGARAGGAPEG